jgi:predicted O-methyltransferase YrrM
MELDQVRRGHNGQSMTTVTPRSANNIPPEAHEEEWTAYTEAAWAHNIPTADLRYMSEFIHLIDKYSSSSTKSILEWGTGFTTRWLCALAEKRSADLFVAVDTNAAYLADVVAFMPKTTYRFEAHAIQEIGETDDLSRSHALHYATFPLRYETRFDLTFIDGRRRNECLLAAAILQSNQGYVLVHDFRRKRYELGMSMFDCVEDFFGFRVLRRRKDLDSFADERFQSLTKDARTLPVAFAQLTSDVRSGESTDD